MSIKGIVQKVVGQERLSTLKGQVLHYVCSLKLGRSGKLQIPGTRLSLHKELTSPGYHVFRGYYDLQYMNAEKEIFLVHRLPVNAGSNRDTRIQIGYYDLHSLDFHKVSESYAWCWQQGSRLRWHPTKKNSVLFNDIDRETGSYCTRIVDICTNEETEKISWPLYDLASDFSYGLSLNYERLQRLRPGYGYNYYGDSTIDCPMPEDDGLFRIDIEKREARLLFSLKELASAGNVGDEKECYLNHISVSPDNQHFLFFLISREPQIKGWDTVLFVADKSGESLRAIEKQDRVSHYCWMDNAHIMVTCHRKDNTEYYCVYDIFSGEKEILSIANLDMDGHPNVYSTDEFITDTYPHDNSLQRIRFFTLQDNEAKTEMAIYHDYRLRGEKRCDLHPSVERDGRYIAIDTTYKAGRRSVLILSTRRDK